MSTNQYADLVLVQEAKNWIEHETDKTAVGDYTHSYAMGIIDRLCIAIERLSAPLEVNDAMVKLACRVFYDARGERFHDSRVQMRAALEAALTERKA